MLTWQMYKLWKTCNRVVYRWIALVLIKLVHMYVGSFHYVNIIAINFRTMYYIVHTYKTISDDDPSVGRVGTLAIVAQQLFFVGVVIVVARFTRVDGAFSGAASPQNSSKSSNAQRESAANSSSRCQCATLPAKVLNAKSILAISLSQ